MKNGLDRLLRPNSIAVLGGDWAKAVILSSREVGYQGEIWPVHPHHEDVAGIKAYRSVDDLPSAPDAVFVGINRKASIGVVRQLSEMGAGGVVAFASGFAEVDDGAELQDQLVEAAGAMPVVGPNCYGVINYLDAALLWPDIHGGSRVDKGVAIITQSSNLAINLTMDQNGLSTAYIITLGNQAMVTMADMIRALAADDRVTAIGLHIEGVRNSHDFAAAISEARDRGKPVIAIKAGASDAARKMTMSHTASLAGSHQVASAFFAASGVGQVNSIEAFLQALGLLHCFGELTGKSLMTMSCSGGEASLMADAAQRHGIPLPDFDDAAIAAIAETVNPLVTVSNPFDYHTFDWGDEERLTASFTCALAAGIDINALVLDFPAGHITRVEGWHAAIRAIKAARDATGARAAVIASMPENMPPEVARDLMQDGIAPLRGFDTALEAINAAHAASAHSASKDKGFQPIGLDPVGGEAETLTEAEAKAMLKASGVPVPDGRVASSLDEALGFAEGRVVVMKTVTAAHKTEQGGVKLNINDPDAVRVAWHDLTHGQASPHVLIEEMITDSVAEMIIGVGRDATYGLHLVIGAGGIQTEIWRDTMTLMLPASPEDVSKAIGTLTMAPLLKGFRGMPPGDEAALMECIWNIAGFALAHEKTLLELDINPLLVRPGGVVAVDALIRCAK